MAEKTKLNLLLRRNCPIWVLVLFLFNFVFILFWCLVIAMFCLFYRKKNAVSFLLENGGMYVVAALLSSAKEDHQV